MATGKIKDNLMSCMFSKVVDQKLPESHSKDPLKLLVNNIEGKIDLFLLSILFSQYRSCDNN